MKANSPGEDDPIVAEIRRAREEYAESLGHDIQLIVADTNRRGQALDEAVARLDEDPNALGDLLGSKRWNGGRGRFLADTD
jgi:hypothetical protein